MYTNELFILKIKLHHFQFNYKNDKQFCLIIMNIIIVL